jgi:hypothetical protein
VSYPQTTNTKVKLKFNMKKLMELLITGTAENLTGIVHVLYFISYKKEPV